MTFTPKKILLLFVVLLVGISASSVLVISSWLTEEVSVKEQHRVLLIAKGSSLYALASQLNEMELIRWPRVWVRYAQLSEQTQIKAGEYQLPENVSPKELLQLFNKGEVIQYPITLVEGFTFRELLAHIHTHERIVPTLLGLNDREIIQALALDIEHLEGWFFPDTYRWTAGDSDASILLQAHRKMRAVLAEEWQQRAQDLPYDNPYEALIMASIVEKETGAAFERDLIAGVFVRRLQSGMRLQTDPTVIYGMGENYRGNITRKDLKTATAYNTYVIKGLPPTPIAMPGREAIHAALHPAAGSALFFVARGDGTHVFSDTVEEHNKAVRQYQLKRKRDYRSAPQQQLPQQ